jgi:hypothetical protein
MKTNKKIKNTNIKEREFCLNFKNFISFFIYFHSFFSVIVFSLNYFNYEKKSRGVESVRRENKNMNTITK